MVEQEDSILFQAPGLPACYCPSMQEMQTYDKLSDITIQAGYLSIKAHRVVLCAGIPYFKVMFTSDMVESRQKVVDMKNIDPQALKELINFIYTNRIRITMGNVISLLHTSSYLQLEIIRDACLDFLLQRIAVENVLMLRSYVEMANDVERMEIVDRYVRENFEEVSLSEDFSYLTLESLKHFISRSDLFVMKEGAVFDAIMKWVRASESSRLVHLAELLQHVRMVWIEPEFLHVRALAEPLIQSSPACRALLDNVTNFPVRERFCKEKHHLKCAKLVGSGMYVIFHNEDSEISVRYFDSANREWRVLIEKVIIYMACPLYAVCTESKLYILDEVHIHVLDLTTLQFTKLEHDGSCCVSTGVVYHNHQLYFFGGSYGKRYREVRTLNLQNGRAELVGEMILERGNPSCVSLGRYIYVTGGLSPTYSSLISVERFDPETRQSVEVSPMFIGRASHGATALNGKIYVNGGSTHYHDRIFGGSSTNNGEIYDPETNQWTFINRGNGTIDLLQFVPYAKRLYAFHNLPFDNLPVESYDADENQWKSEMPVPYNSGTCKAAAVVVTNSASSYIDETAGYHRREDDDQPDDDNSDGDYSSNESLHNPADEADMNFCNYPEHFSDDDMEVDI